MRLLVHAISSEWLKRRRALTTWLVIGAAGFVPAVICASRFRHLPALPALYAAPEFWPLLWTQAWESMALAILPLSVMMIVSLITQIEDRNNGWKQLHAAPVPLPAIYVAKLTVVLVLAAILIGLHIAAIYAAGVVPAILLRDVPQPARPFPLLAFLNRGTAFFVDIMPIAAIQYAIALRARTFLPPLGIGMAAWILSIGTISWRYNFTIPYSHAALDYLAVEYHRRLPLPAALPVIAGACFLVFSVAGYFVYATRRDKG
jgi:hypothetical protein